MDKEFGGPVQFSKGINLREVMTSFSEFHIDMDFKKKAGANDFFPDLDDTSDTEDAHKLIEESTEKKMLASPEYHSFDELAEKMIDCEPGGNVKILILEEGSGPLVPVDAEVKIHYAAYWEKANIPFDSTLTMNYGKPLRCRLGEGRVIPGLELALTTVKGPKARFMLIVQPLFSWGPMGVPPRVRPEPALFVITLYDVRDIHAAARFNDLPQEEQSKFGVTIRTVKSIHEDAKNLFKHRKYERAIDSYQHSIMVLKISRPETENEEEALKNLKIKALLNLAVCYAKINKPKYVIGMLESLDYVMDTDKHCKALFYYGKANEMLGKTELAVEYYQKALKLEPKNRDIGKTLQNLDGYLKKSAKNEKEMWQGVFKAEKEDKIEVDEDFQNGVKALFEDLVRNKEYARFDLPPGLKSSEVDFVKRLAKDFGLIVHEEGKGKRKKTTVVKQIII